jgi:PAS domain S-box-containing protein
MSGVVPDSSPETGRPDAADRLELPFEALLEFTNAACGWIGLIDAQHRLTFPVRRGAVPEGWLTLQGGQQVVWGFALRDGPTLLNDLPPWPALGSPPLNNLLSCPLEQRGRVLGHLVLANKASGFTSHDAAVAQGIAHFLAKLVAQTTEAREQPAPLLRGLPPQALDLAREGIFILDQQGVLVFANAAWAEWTGFSQQELLLQRAPFSFWVSHHRLATLGSALTPTEVVSATAGSGATKALAVLPFRKRDESIFWCQVETRRLEWLGKAWTIASLHPALPPLQAPREAPAVMTRGVVAGFM